MNHRVRAKGKKDPEAPHLSADREDRAVRMG